MPRQSKDITFDHIRDLCAELEVGPDEIHMGSDEELNDCAHLLGFSRIHPETIRAIRNKAEALQDRIRSGRRQY
jgi:hypothetical protein